MTRAKSTTDRSSARRRALHSEGSDKVVLLREARRSSRPPRGIHQIGLAHLLDFLSELLMIQKCSIQLMALARDRSASPDARELLAKAVESVEATSDRLRIVVRDLGGNPVSISSAASVQEERAAGLLKLETPSRLQRLSDIENCWCVSLQENVHLAFLRSILPYLETIHARDLLEDVLADAAREHEGRLEWLEQELHRQLLQRAIMPSDGNDWYRTA